MKYLCTNCSFTFDEAFGDRDENIIPGTIFDEHSKCPVCEEYDTFHQIQEQINYIGESFACDPMEEEHFLEIFHRNNKIVVVVGRVPHTMGENHRIGSICLLDEYGDIIEEKFLEVDSEPMVEFDDEDYGDYEIRAKCSLHGIWGRKIYE